MNFKVLFFDSSVNANSISLQIRFSGGYREKEISFPEALKIYHENQVDFNLAIRAVNWNSEFVIMESRSPLGLEEMYAGGYIVPVRTFFEKYFDREIIEVMLEEFAQEIREEWEEAADVEGEDLEREAWKDYFRGCTFSPLFFHNQITNYEFEITTRADVRGNYQG